MSKFEDLSNEIIYEIFDFFDYFHAYETFSYLNARFHNLFTRSRFPLKLNFSSITKSTFEICCEDVIKHNEDRIKSLCLSTPLLIEHFFTSFSINASFIRLEIIILYRINSNSLLSVLEDLSSLPRLICLTMIVEGMVHAPRLIHQLIFGLPVLEYCNISLDWPSKGLSLPESINSINKIKELIIDGPYNLRDIVCLLSYTPELVRLKCYRLLEERISEPMLNVRLANLIDVHLNLSISFDRFEEFVSNILGGIEILRISVMSIGDNFNVEYLDSNRWERLIFNDIPRLHSFHLESFGKIHQNNEHITDRLIDKFNSTFWIKRNCFFVHRYYQLNGSIWLDFSSSKSDRYGTKKNVCRVESHRQLIISDPSISVKYTCRSSYFTDLILMGTFYKRTNSFLIDLGSMVPLTRVTQLVLLCESFTLSQLIDLLQLSSNVRHLSLVRNPRCPVSERGMILPLDEENIDNIPNRGLLTLKHVRALMKVSPRLQSLQMSINENYLESILRFLFQFDMSKSRCLSLLRIQDAHYGIIRRIQKIIDLDKFIEHYTLQHISDNAFLWW